jgi:hypothetical protein
MADETRAAPAVDLASLTPADFAPRTGERFTLVRAGGNLELTLRECRALGWSGPGARRAFSLTFLGPLSPVQPQQMVTLLHPALTLVDIFIVPLGPGGPEENGMRYEAVFT